MFLAVVFAIVRTMAMVIAMPMTLLTATIMLLLVRVVGGEAVGVVADGVLDCGGVDDDYDAY
eukprot:2180309-Alexandrium_andersonii.AAC.1